MTDDPGTAPPASPPSGSVVVGTSGFSFDDWVGPFYPPGTPRAAMLEHYARHFQAVEINSTYYGIPPPRTMERLDARTPAGFEFLVKAHQSMTHSREEPTDETFRAFHGAVEPLLTAGKFHGVLLQFPWAFRPTRRARHRLERLDAGLAGLRPLFVEFRHASWLDSERAFQFLEERGMGYCSVDEPALPGLLPPVARRIGPVAYVRFHGRNRDTWWGRGGGDRYDYNYKPEELKEWVTRIRELAERASKVYVFFNNCHAGQAARNALLMREMLQQDLGPGVR